MYLDDYVADAFVKHTNIFQNIHPNIITASSLVLNIFILIILLKWRNGINIPLIGSILVFRCATDIFDGAVARKYNKSSKLGGYLDTIGDFSLFIIFFYYIFDRYNCSSIYWIPFLGLLFYSLICFDIAHDHSSLKIYDGGLFQHFCAFWANNTIVLFTIMYAAIWKSNVGHNGKGNVA
jgi:phosphatidylglycerophosphate synthase